MGILDVIYSLLPRGPLWPDVAGDSPDFDALLDATAQEPERIQAEGTAWLADFFPDVTVDQLADWERLIGVNSPPDYTEAQRRAHILEHLRGPGDPNYPRLSALALDALGITLHHKLWPLPVADQMIAGDEVRGDEWASTWDAEYGEALGSDPEAVTVTPTGSAIFLDYADEGWSGPVLSRIYRIPSGDSVQIAIAVAAASDDLRFRCRVHTIDYFDPTLEAPIRELTVTPVNKSGASGTAQVGNIDGAWHHVQVDFNAGTGGSSPYVELTNSDASQMDVVISWIVAHVVDDVKEDELYHIPLPLHTYGFFAPLRDAGDI